MPGLRTHTWMAMVALVAGPIQAQTNAGAPFPPTGLDFSGVDRFWSVARLLTHDSEPSAAQWLALLSTPGYRLARRNLGPGLQDGIDLALRPSRRAEFLRATAPHDERGLALEHLALAWARRTELEAYRDSLARGTPISDAVALAGRFLPPGWTRNGAPPLVTFALFKDDGYSFPEGIVVDLLYARILARGGTPLTTTLAHEFHHSYVNRMARPAPPGPRPPDADLRDALYSLRNEGLADLIDKPYPFASPDSGLSAYSARYNAEYARTPAVLRQFDALLTTIAPGPGATPEVSMRAAMLFWSNGHPNGAYIAREILETFGVDSLFPAARDPAALLRTFQWAERRHGRPDPLSPSAWRVLDALDARYWATSLRPKRAAPPPDRLR